MEDKEVYWTAQAKLGHKQARNNPRDAGSQGGQATMEMKTPGASLLAEWCKPRGPQCLCLEGHKKVSLSQDQDCGLIEGERALDAQLDGAQHRWMFQNLAARNNHTRTKKRSPFLLQYPSSTLYWHNLILCLLAKKK